MKNLFKKKEKKQENIYLSAAHGIMLKKQFGQHFLRNQAVIDHMLEQVTLTADSSVFEIGCGDGFLTKSILQTSLARLWVFEIDPEWATYVSKTYADPRMTMYKENILDVDFARFDQYKPWTLLANLPYQVTFPILHKLQQHRNILAEGVIMVQEEVAQKIVQVYGRGYGFPSLFFQHFFHWRLLDKVLPNSFYPPPKVDSRLIYFKPRQELDAIPLEPEFWKFIKRCFLRPRKTLKNNLQSYHYNLSLVSQEQLALRAQQLNKQDLLNLWNTILAATSNR